MPKISHDIELLNIIGKGAYGDVYMGKNIKTKEIYAIKKITKKQLESQTIYQYFNNEIYILKHLNHPNIVKFKSLIEYKTDFYLCTEYCDGGNLEQVMKYHIESFQKSIPEEIVRYFMYNILLGIIYLNKNNLIHRDIKTDNILLHYDNEEDLVTHNYLKAKIKIIDFGFARYLEKNELAGSLVGTPMYMEPSILKTFITSTKRVVDGFYDKKVDVWSLGILTYELLIGIVPFIAKNIKGLFHSMEQRDFCIPKEEKRNLELSKAAINFIDKTLNIDMSMRPLPEELIKDPWISGKFNKQNLYKMKSNNEIALVEKKTNFANFWKPCGKIKKNSNKLKNVINNNNNNIVDNSESTMKKKLEIVGLSYIDPSKTNKIQSGAKLDFQKIKNLLNISKGNTCKLLNNYNYKVKNQKRQFLSKSEKDFGTEALNEIGNKTERINYNYDKNIEKKDEEIEIPGLSIKNPKIKTIRQIKISNLNKISDDNNKINRTISSYRGNKIKAHNIKNNSVNNKIYSNYNKSALKRFKIKTISNSFKTLNYDKNDKKENSLIKSKFSYSNANNTINNSNNKIINHNNITNYINNINNNIYINESDYNNNSTSYINTEVKVYKKKFSFRKEKNSNFNSFKNENPKKISNKSQNNESLESNIKTYVKKYQISGIPKINSKLKEILRLKPKFCISQKNKETIDLD